AQQSPAVSAGGAVKRLTPVPHWCLAAATSAAIGAETAYACDLHLPIHQRCTPVPPRAQSLLHTQCKSLSHGSRRSLAPALCDMRKGVQHNARAGIPHGTPRTAASSWRQSREDTTATADAPECGARGRDAPRRSVSGVCLECVWSVSGVCLECVWRACDSPL